MPPGAGRARVRQYPVLLLLVLGGLLFGGFLVTRWTHWADRALMRLYDALDARDTGPLEFSGHLVGSPMSGIKHVYAVDVDGDGDLDVLSFVERGAREQAQMAWYENTAGDGSSWTTHPIGQVRAAGIVPHDLDGDGDVDVSIEPLKDATPGWYENDAEASPRFQPHLGAQNAPPSPEAAPDSADALEALLASLDNPSIIDPAGYGSPADAPPVMTVGDLLTQTQEGRGVAVADLDGDLDADLLAALPDRGMLTWYENSGPPAARLTAHLLSSRAYGAGNVCAADMDGDGDLDILAGFMGDRIVWWEQQGVGNSFPRLTAEQAVVTVSEAQAATNRGRVSDANGDPISLDVSLGEVVDEGQGGWSWRYVPPPGSEERREVTVTARDARGAATSLSFELVVERPPPRVLLSIPSLVELDSAELGTGAVDALDCDTWLVRVDYGDGSREETLRLSLECSFELSHAYREPGEYTLTACVQGNGLQEGCASHALTVVQSAPEVRLYNRSGQIPEGGTALLAFSRQGSAGHYVAAPVLRYSFDCTDDGVYEVEAQPDRWLYRCLYPENGLYTARGRVEQEGEDPIELRVSVQVDNVPPTAHFEYDDKRVRAGEPLLLVFDESADVSPGDAQAGFQYAYDCNGDGVYEREGTSERAHTCTYSESGAYTARGRIVDRDGGWSEYTLDVQVLPARAVLRFAGPAEPVDEGAPARLAFMDLGGTRPEWRYWFDCTGDGAYEGRETPAASFECTYPDQGTYTARGRTVDEYGDTTEYETTVVVRNVAPTATLASTSGTVYEGEPVSLFFQDPRDPGVQDAAAGYRYSFDCAGDGEYEVLDTPGTSYRCVYEQDGLYVARARIADRDGDGSEYTLQIQVVNAPPRAGVPDAIAVDEGQTYALALSEPHDPSPIDTAAGFRYSYDCAGDGLFEVVDGTSPRHNCTYPDDGSILTRVRIADLGGAATVYTIRVTARNVTPTVSALSLPPGPFPIGKEVELSAEYADPGVLDAHSARWEWGDGCVSSGRVSPDPETEVGRTGSVTGTHAYLDPGLYVVQLLVSDCDGGVGASDPAEVPVYDPAAAWAHGEATFTSPSGAYALNPAFSRQARLAFDGQYASDASAGVAPQGEIEFELVGGGMAFEAHELDWLVVAGTRVWIAGTGAINGVGRYGISVALDLGPDGGRVRIRVWDRENVGALIYDSQPGAALDAAPTITLTEDRVVLPGQ